MKLLDARNLADDLLRSMESCVVRAAIAGSIRRTSAEVKDIEIVAIPRWLEHTSVDLFGWARRRENLLFEGWYPDVTWLKGHKPEGRYWQGQLPSGIKLDLFLTQPENFGLIYLLRTGSWEFSRAVVTHAKAIGRPACDGFLWDGLLCSERFATPEEQDVFELLGLEWVAPAERTGSGAVRKLRT